MSYRLGERGYSVKLNDIHKMNIDALEHERIRGVIFRAKQFAEQYEAAKATFSEIGCNATYVRHEKGHTVIIPWTGHVYSLTRIRSFIEREKGVFYHRSAPVRLIVSGYQAKVIIDWGTAQ